MNRILHTFLACLITQSLFATVIVVSNQAGIGVNFSNLQAAANAAQSGDTIHVQPSPIAYAGFQYLDKKLTIFGAGFKPDKDLGMQSIIISMLVGDQANIPGSPSGSSFEGIIFDGTVQIGYQFTGSLGLSNISFRRCEFRGTPGFSTLRFGFVSNQVFSNILIESCYFNNSELAMHNPSVNISNVVIRNNVFRTSLNNRSISGFENASNVLVDHNLFYANAQRVCFSNCRFLLISNNVFINHDAVGSSIAFGLSNSTFNNNITFGGTNLAPWTMQGNINGGGNIENQDPQIAAGTALLSTSQPDNPLLDFSIAAGPANNAANDGKDMGLLFDNNTSINWNFARNALLPYVKTMNITNPTLAPGATLNVNIIAVAAQ